jgi:protein ImuB
MFAVLHVSVFSLQAVLRLEHALASRPVALIDETRRPPVVIACTEAARAAGVEAGQTAPQAMARCATVILRGPNGDAETEARAGLIAAALSVSPQVEDTAPGVCTIFVGGLEKKRREPALCAAVAQLRALGLTATAGLATTPLLALYAAQQGRAEPLGPPVSVVFEPYGQTTRAVSEKVELDVPIGLVCEKGERTQSSPTGTSGSTFMCEESAEVVGRTSASKAISGRGSARAAMRVHREETRAREVFCVDDQREFLRDLPLQVAEPPANIAGILAGWGVRTLGGLTALSKADVTQRLGPEGLALWERAAGEVTRPLRMITPPQTFAAEMTVEYEIETLEPLLFVLRRFIDRLALELRNAGFVAGEMTLGLMLADETAHTRAFRLPEPTAQEEILFRVLHTHLESLHTAATVRGVSLECWPVRPLARQQGLFESALRDPHGFAETLGRVAAVVGPERVGTPVLENTHRPDAVQLSVPAAVIPPMAKADVHPARGLPLRRFREPLTATVELSGASPVFVWTSSVQGAVRAIGGPWRGSGEWWDVGRLWRREEWDVELESGGVYRLLRKPEGWFVEGEYD